MLERLTCLSVIIFSVTALGIYVREDVLYRDHYLKKWKEKYQA